MSNYLEGLLLLLGKTDSVCRLSKFLNVFNDDPPSYDIVDIGNR